MSESIETLVNEFSANPNDKTSVMRAEINRIKKGVNDTKK